MKRIIFFLFVFFLVFGLALAEKEGKWNQEKGTHFIIYYHNASRPFISKLLEKAEEYYNSIADDLGFRRFDFWLWDKRAKIFVYDNALAYQASTGQPAWSLGCARAEDKIIDTYVDAEGFSEGVLPHEMAHIIFRELVGFHNKAIPLWLDEGVASYEQKDKYSNVNAIIYSAIRDKSFMTLESLFKFSLNHNLSNKSVELFYCESYSIVDFLIKNYGRDRFVLFCQNLRDKKNFEKALISSYPFNNVGEFAKAWQKDFRHE
ncbi:MAG: hypothetical protein KJ880_06175 [Candidatus Omnitrophica bacterium]|nr:hypothetical protein [Candidatus Omnitrophota bacterium]MBU1870293.1 hypothetical protein [Candidatus Omnitrophota bacterium]